MLAMCLLLLGLFSATAAEVREWSDSTGKFKIKAKLVAQDKGKVTLEKEDGSQFEIDLKKLSPADQKYLIEQVPMEDDPFKPKKKVNLPKGNEPKVEPKIDESEAELVTPDFADIKLLALIPTKEKWEFPEAKVEAPKQANLGIPLPPKSDFFEKSHGFVVNPIAGRALIGYTLQRPGQRDQVTTRIVLCDLQNGKQIMTGTTNGTMVPLALSDNGTQVIMKQEVFGFGKSDRLELWDLDGKEIKKTSAWIPYASVQGGDRDVLWATFIDAKRFATCSTGGKLTLWETEKLKPLFELAIGKNSTPALSPDRRFIGFTTGPEVGLLDVTSNEVVAVQTVQNLHGGHISFSQDGKRFAACSSGQLFVWEVGTGKLYREMPLEGVVANSPAQWVSSGQILVGSTPFGHSLIDLESRIKVWVYTGHEGLQTIGDISWFVVQDGTDKPGGLIPTRLPHPAAVDALKKAQMDPTFFVLKMGTVVKLDTTGVTDEAEAERLTGVMKTKLETNGCKIGDDGDITLFLATEKGELKEMNFRNVRNGPGFGPGFRPGFGPIGPRGPFGDDGPVRVHKVREYFSRAKFMYDGKVVWELVTVNIPQFIQLKEGETLEAYLKKMEKPNYAWFDSIGLPKTLTKNAKPTLGITRLTTAGVR